MGNTTDKNNVILGLAGGYHFGDVRPFLLSLKNCGYTGDVVLFTSPTTREVEKMSSYATVVPFLPDEKYAHLSFNAQRYPLYHFFLKQNTQWDNIFITDVRDVIFQRDPFSYPWADGLNITLEDASKTIRTCPYNSHWVRHHLGKAMLDKIGNERISCSGTTMGDYASMLSYLERMVDELLPFTPMDAMGGYDQGIHNMLIHTEKQPCTRHDNSGPILTLAYKQNLPDLDNNGEILNDAGEIATIVHQYDRKPDLFKMLRDKY